MTAVAAPPVLVARGLVLIVPFYPRVACCACRVLLTHSQAERVPGHPWMHRCGDEDGCIQRFTPRRLAWSVRRVA